MKTLSDGSEFLDFHELFASLNIRKDDPDSLVGSAEICFVTYAINCCGMTEIQPYLFRITTNDPLDSGKSDNRPHWLCRINPECRAD